MGNDQDTTVGYRPMSVSTFAAGAEIAAGGSATVRGLIDLAYNDNTRWAQSRPALLAHGCQSKWSATIRETDMAFPAYPRLAYRFWVGGDARGSLVVKIRAKADATDRGYVKIASGGNSVTISATTTSWTKYSGTLTLGVVNGYAIVTVYMRTNKGIGMDLREIAAHVAPLSGALPAGVQASGFAPHDVGELGDGEPCSICLARRWLSNLRQDLAGAVGPRVWVGFCTNIVGGTYPVQHSFMHTPNTYWTAVTVPFDVCRQIGMSALRYNMLAGQDGGAPVAKVRVRNLVTGHIGAEHDLASCAALSPETHADWICGTIPITPLRAGTDVTQPERDTFVVEVRSNGTNFAGLLALCVQEEPSA